MERPMTTIPGTELRSRGRLMCSASFGLFALLAAGCTAGPGAGKEGSPGIAVLQPAPTAAPDKASEVDRIFGWATPTAPGCVVAVSRNGKPLVTRSYGSA